MADPVVLPYVPSTSIFKNDIFKGKVAFVTGGGSGICQTMTLNLMQHGCSAAIVGRKADRLQASADWLQKQAGNGTKCIATPADVRTPTDLNEAVRKTVEAFGRIDFVICGAAGNFLAPMDGLSENAFRTVIEIDLLGTYNTFKATIDELKKSHGAYIHISATLHYNGLPWQAAASAAKAGIDALNQSIAVEYGPFGVRSNVIAPGLIADTEGADRLTPKGAEDFMSMRIPLQRSGQKGDIGNMAIFLFSDAASYISGSRFIVDGANWHNGGFWLPYPDSQLDPKSIKDLISGSKL
ncbi:NAD(P)-binding protein [Tilletiaria anomala UBC 951]|uniref:2,4-dienoyl-CoA reductase [(3E)-enoyl-CoA-producing] n=1 Tax=Tilletiaria anomala (strain ATCC 24038 / CBS 436.72 / UBC 951) TaxID=1037660 RepID=A0A066W5F9_TILAU|nr:NAD(P)-binding protein [Tilletiaria anomala UBC 951]KDN49207.1 NAD(P)-binding protein [Tilletiaria anomala UBC 951]